MASKSQPGDIAIQVAKELQFDASIPRYNNELLGQIEKEMVSLQHSLQTHLSRLQELSDELRTIQEEEEEGNVSEERDKLKEKLTDENNSTSAAVIIEHQSLLRNKRIVLAYHYERMKRIRKLRWGSGAVQNMPNFIVQNMSDEEKDYLNKYDETLRNYTDDLGIDLFSDVTPPKDIFVQVKVIKEDPENTEGIYTMDSGVIKLQKNDLLFLRRTDAELFIQRGLVEQLSWRIH
jgi:GINS complex subunit 1